MHPHPSPFRGWFPFPNRQYLFSKWQIFSRFAPSVPGAANHGRVSFSPVPRPKPVRPGAPPAGALVYPVFCAFTTQGGTLHPVALFQGAKKAMWSLHSHNLNNLDQIICASSPHHQICTSCKIHSTFRQPPPSPFYHSHETSSKNSHFTFAENLPAICTSAQISLKSI